MTGKPSKAVLIERRLLALYPSRVVPRGVLEAMDAEFGVSRQYCKKIARQLGFTVPRREDKPRICRVCGAQSRPGSSYCFDCQHVELTCARCGSVFRRPRATVAGLTAARLAARPDQHFCSFACHAAMPTSAAPNEFSRRRVAAGLTQAALARALGVSTTLVNMGELGTRAIPPARMAELDALFKAHAEASAPTQAVDGPRRPGTHGQSGT